MASAQSILGFSFFPCVFSKYMTLSCLNVSGLLLLLLSRTVAEKRPIIYSLQFSHRLRNCPLFSPLFEKCLGT